MVLKKGKSKTRGRGEKWYEMAKEQGFRSRAAFKLIQLNKKYDFLSSAKLLIDLCAAPGGWLQVARKYMPVSSLVVGVDLVPIKPIKNVITLMEDITSSKCRAELKKSIHGWKADVVLHDGAPNMGTSWLQDAYSQSELVLMSLRLATEFLVPGGTFVTKVFRSADYNSLLWVFHQLFKKVEATKPVASRQVSAEIFVVCKGYIAPDKVDSKLLDPKYVFKDLEVPTKTTDVFTTSKKKPRQRDGYEDGNYILFKDCPVEEFIYSHDPIKLMGEYNKLTFGPDSDKFKQHPKTTPEVLSCCDDMKVLGKSDFKLLLKWRLYMKDAFREKKQITEEASEDMEEEKGEENSGEEEEAVDEELDKRISALSKKEKRKEKKRRLQIAKQKLRKMNSENFSISDDPELFSFSKVTTDLEFLANTTATNEDDVEENTDEEGMPEDYDDIVEKHLENMYERYLSTTVTGIKPEKKKKRRDTLTEVSRPVRHQAFNPDVTTNIEDFLEGKPNPGAAAPSGTYHSDDDDEYDDETFADEYGAQHNSNGETMTKRAAQWFSKSIFQGMDDLEDGLDETDEQPASAVKSTAHDTSDGDDAFEEETHEEEDVIVSAGGHYANGLQTNDNEVADQAGADDFEVVPIEKPDSGSDDSESDEDDIDADKQVKVLAMGTMMLSKKRKRELIDDSYNRFAWNDPDGLPSWFRDDENKHNKPSLPMTKELMDRIRQKFMEINARPIKKIAEAKARKKMKAIARFEKVKNKAEVISNNDELSEKEKNRAMEKLYKGRVDKMKPGKTYVVAKKSNKGRVAGGRGVKIVDSRMKKDLKAERAKEKGKVRGKVKGRGQGKGKGKGKTGGKGKPRNGYGRS